MRAIQLHVPLRQQAMSYAAAARRNTPVNTSSTASEPAQSQANGNTNATVSKRRSPSPSHIPRTNQPEEETYVLTFHTSRRLHSRMTALRNKYFPKHLNKLAAHLTLFHALPGSRLESDIIPAIEHLASQTDTFPITATGPLRLGKRGIAIAVDDGSKAREVRDALQARWKKDGFLSQQDARRTDEKFPHYTVMYKVDDEVEVQKALDELRSEFEPDEDFVDGLALHRYDKGWWQWMRTFRFKFECERANEQSQIE